MSSHDDRERVLCWVERAARDAAGLGHEDVGRMGAVLALNPPEREEAITRLSDGELFVLGEMTSTPVGEAFADGMGEGRIRTVPPGGKVVLTAAVLAELGVVRQQAVEEGCRRALGRAWPEEPPELRP